MKTVQENSKTSFDKIKKSLHFTNVMQSPRLQKVVVNIGTGSIKDKNKVKLIADRLAKITGQKPAVRGSKKSIAAFKVREGDPVGYQVTLRGKRMKSFLNKLLLVALPRTKDFRGIPVSGIDQMGNYSLGIREHTIFPETSDEDIKDVFGMAVTIVTSAHNKEEARAFFDALEFPFKKDE